MKIEDGRVVLIDYVLTNGDGVVLDSSPEGEPLAYLHGAAGIVPALEDELEGQYAGHAFDLTIKPEDGYGEYMPEAVKQLPRSQVPPEVNLQIGMQVQDSSGVEAPSVVTAINDEFVTLDGNHPLAGQTLRFKGSIAEVREPSEEELKSLSDLDEV